MYPRIPWELVADPLGSAEHTLGTTALEHQHYTKLLLINVTAARWVIKYVTTFMELINSLACLFTRALLRETLIHSYNDILFLKVLQSLKLAAEQQTTSQATWIKVTHY
jgi:hypothetical protein